MVSRRSKQFMIPLLVFFVRCGDTDIAKVTTCFVPCSRTVKLNSFVISALLASSSLTNSTSRPPSLSLSHLATLPSLSQPSLRWKGESEASLLSSEDKIRTFGCRGWGAAEAGGSRGWGAAEAGGSRGWGAAGAGGSRGRGAAEAEVRFRAS